MRQENGEPRSVNPIFLRIFFWEYIFQIMYFATVFAEYSFMKFCKQILISRRQERGRGDQNIFFWAYIFLKIYPRMNIFFWAYISENISQKEYTFLSIYFCLKISPRKNIFWEMYILREAWEWFDLAVLEISDSAEGRPMPISLLPQSGEMTLLLSDGGGDYDMYIVQCVRSWRWLWCLQWWWWCIQWWRWQWLRKP